MMQFGEKNIARTFNDFYLNLRKNLATKII